jgi:hypothetical protein
MHSGIMSGQAIEQWLTEPTTAFTPPADTTTPPGNPITPQPTTPIQDTTDSQPGAQQVVPATKEEIEKFVEEGVYRKEKRRRMQPHHSSLKIIPTSIQDYRKRRSPIP